VTGQVGASAAEVVAAVPDPELRPLTIEDLGILRTVEVEPGGRVRVTITPTYAGCPALDVIRSEIRRALRNAGHLDVAVDTVLAPAWTTDLISESGRAKLAAAGIAAPEPVGSRSPAPPMRPVRVALSVRCPRCGGAETEELSRFGATACKALWRCRACGEPFERVKPL
jgi:ring-1,2-phenylacetyl-CoA epoxidase subunit PaaD